MLDSHSASSQMGKFEKEAKDLLDAIGGKENVTAVSHCATRMRFVLGDDKKANVKAIEAIPVVKGTFTNAGQFQVIIGNDVPIFYNDFTAVSGIEGVSKEAAKSAAKSNQNPLQRIMATLAEIFTPLIPALIVGGLILGFRNVLEGVQIEALGRKIVDGVAQVKNGQPVYNTIVDAIASDDKVVANMEGVSSLPSIFLNVSIGKVIDDYDIDTLKRHVSFCKITRKQAERLKDYLLRYN